MWTTSMFINCPRCQLPQMRPVPACCTFLSDSVAAFDRCSTGTCRAAMALLRQEARFVDHLFASGMVDEAEHEQLLKPIEKRERRMQRQGALWRVPLISEVGNRAGAPHLAPSVRRLHSTPPVLPAPSCCHVRHRQHAAAEALWPGPSSLRGASKLWVGRCV